jgi:mannosyltransferase
VDARIDERVIAPVIGVSAAAFTAWGSWVPSLWGDEAATVLSAERSLPSLWAMVQHLDAMHAVYYLLMHFWIGAFGASPFAVRLPSALAVGAGAAGLFVVIRMLGRGVWPATLTAAIYVVLPRMQYIGQEARSFPWDAALVTWTIAAFTASAQGRLSRRAGWSLYAVGAALAIALFPYDLSVIGIVGVVVLAGRRRDLFAGWAIASAAAVAAASPVLVLSFLERGQVAYLADSPVTASQVFVSTWFGNIGFALLAWALVATALVAHLVGGTAGRRHEQPTGVPPFTLLVVWAFLPITLLLVTQPFLHNFAERYVAFSAPAVAALIAEGIGIIAARTRVAAVVAGACLLAVTIVATAQQRTPNSESDSDWGQVAAYLHDRAHPGDDILFAQTVSASKRARNSLRLYPGDYRGLRDVALVRPWFRNAYSWHDAALTIPEAIATGRVTAKVVWVVETSGSRDEGARRLQALGYTEVASRHFTLDTVYRFSR